MLIGVSTDNEGNFYSGYEFSPREVVLYEAKLPKDVETALGLMRHNFNERDAPPLAFQAFAGHGKDYGLVFRNNYYEEVNLNPNTCSSDIKTKNLVGRVSFGMEYIEKLKEKGIFCKDPSKMTRLHLNLFGARQFLPENFEEIQDKEGEHFNYLIEQIHFSIRWIRGEFDNVWNDFNEWENHKELAYLGHPQFDDMRSTYFYSSEETEHVNGTFVRRKEKVPRQDKKIIDLEDVHQKIGIKFRILPPNLTQEEVMKNFSNSFNIEDLKKVYSFTGYKTRFDTVGYGSVLEILSQFGDISIKDAQKIPHMDMVEGTKYLFNKVFPAMKNYVNSD